MDRCFASSARARAISRVGRRHPATRDRAVAQNPGEDLLEHTQPLGCNLREAVRLLDGYGRLKAMYATIQGAVSAAIAGDEVRIAPGVYAEDLHIHSRLSLTRAGEHAGSDGAAAKVVVVGQVTVAACAVEVIVDGVVIEGGLTMQSAAGATASITLRASGIQGSGASCARLSWLPNVRG